MLFQLYDSDASTAELHMLVAIALDTAHTVQVLTDGHFQRAGTRAMQDAHALGIELDGIIDEIGNGLQGLVGTHAAHVDIGFEIQLARTYLVGRAAAQRFGLGQFRPRCAS